MGPLPKFESFEPAPRLRLVLAATLLCTLGCSTGCESDPRSLPVVEKANHMARLRRDAEDCLAEFQTSGGAALEKLECYAEKHRRTTQLFDRHQDCPLCYLNYGRGLRFLGRYYGTLQRSLEVALETTSSDQVAVFREKISEANDKRRDYYSRSNENFEIYFRLRPAEMAYWWASENAAELDDYEKALRYLELFSEAAELRRPEERQRVEEQRRNFRRRLQRQLVEEIQENRED